MSLRLGDTAPDFDCDSSHGPFRLHSWLDKQPDHWLLFFSHPADFTPVCTTELGQLAVESDIWAFEKCLLLGLSVDSVESHCAWERDILSFVGAAGSQLPFPIVADHNGTVATLYGMLDSPLHDPTNMKTTTLPMTVRSCFLIDPRKRIRCIWTYPASTGRNFREILRTFRALKLSDSHKIATPVNWSLPGAEDRVIVRFDVGDEEAASLFPKMQPTQFNYLRFTPLESCEDGHIKQ